MALSVALLFSASDQMPKDANTNRLSQEIQTRDGDSLETRNGRQIRLMCIDAPEYDQPGGLAAQNTLDSLIADGVRIQSLGTDSFGRTLAVAFPLQGGNQDSINITMIRMGLAWVYRQYANNCGIPRQELCKAEAEARAARIGVWRKSRPVPPWQWRQGRTRPPKRFPACEK